MSFVVAIDGPAGSGKGTVTKMVAKDMNLVSIDTGAMYRCVTLYCLENNINYTENEKIKEALENIDIKFKKDGEVQKVFLNGKDVSNDIRTLKVDSVVAKYAEIKIIRDKMAPIQRKMGETQNIIMEGRDIGTYIFPDADVKIYLDCSLEERAKRRYKQNLEKGIKSTYEEVLENIKERNKLETEREFSPLVKANDAILVDSTNMTIPEVVEKIEIIIKDKMSQEV